jgi:hypothetical protein
MTEVYGDFNTVNPQTTNIIKCRYGILYSQETPTPPLPEFGIRERVMVTDGCGCYCEGEVVAFNPKLNRYISVMLDWDTWKEYEET